MKIRVTREQVEEAWKKLNAGYAYHPKGTLKTIEIPIDPSQVVGDEKITIKDQLDLLSDEERFNIFCNYCLHCGSLNPECQCWNDE